MSTLFLSLSAYYSFPSPSLTLTHLCCQNKGERTLLCSCRMDASSWTQFFLSSWVPAGIERLAELHSSLLTTDLYCSHYGERRCPSESTRLFLQLEYILDVRVHSLYSLRCALIRTNRPSRARRTKICTWQLHPARYST